MSLNKPSPTLSIRMHPRRDSDGPVAVIGPMRLVDAKSGLCELTPLFPSISSPYNQIAATVHRFGCEMPRYDKEEMRRFVCFAKTFIENKFFPLTFEECHSTREWLDSASYSGSRKIALFDLRRNAVTIDAATTVVKSFVKNEAYDEGKNARGINSYSDLSKALVGAIISDSDHKTFSTKWFVKGSNPRDWPEKLREVLGLEKVVETDFSSFEAHHSGPLAGIVRHWIMHMIRHVATNSLKRLISQMVMGRNRIEFKHLTAEIDQRLMSGAMWTSSANGVLNLLLMSYLSLRSQFPEMDSAELVDKVDSNFSGLVEGDDGICVDRGFNTNIIADLGLKLKFEHHDFYGDASFCGIVCTPNMKNVVTDPVKVISRLFVLDKKFVSAKSNVQLSLLRAKALSLKVNFNDCPVIGPLCQRICDLTRGHDVRPVTSENDWKMSKLIPIAVKEKVWQRKPVVDWESRVLVSERFGVPVSLQLEWEEQIGGFTSVLSLDLSLFRSDEKLSFCNRFVGGCSRLDQVPDSIRDIYNNGLNGKTKLKSPFLTGQQCLFTEIRD